MSGVDSQLLKAKRLDVITQRVGFAVWQLQELEGTTAQYFVLVVQAQAGMGFAAGQALVDLAQSKTFGSTIKKLVQAKQLPQAIEARFQTLLAERNWLVHSSRASSRSAVYDDQACGNLLGRLDAIANEAGMLLKEIGRITEVFVRRHGVCEARIEELTAETLRSWHGDDWS